MRNAADWTEIRTGVWEAQGYRIIAARQNGDWMYSAFGPTKTDVKLNDKVKIKYALGERVPMRNDLVGNFGDADAARRACADHAASDTP